MAGVFERTQVGKREDLADYITNVDTHNTPFTSRIKASKKLVRAVFDFQMEAYPQPRRGGVVDGKDAAEWELITERALAHGVAQKFWRLPKVSDFAEHVTDVAGVKSEMARQVRHALIMLKRDMEVTFCAADQECQLDNGVVPYLTRSLGKWLQSTAQALYPVAEAFRTPAAQVDATAIGSTTEATIRAVCKSLWTQTGARKTFPFLMGTDLKEKVSTFPQVSSVSANDLRRIATPADKLAQMVNVLTNDFATLQLELSNWLATDTAYSAKRGFVLDVENIELRYNRMPRVFPQDDKGGGPRSIVDAIAALAVKNPLGSAKFAATA
jgi:hypothetical protein